MNSWELSQTLSAIPCRMPRDVLPQAPQARTQLQNKARIPNRLRLLLSRRRRLPILRTTLLHKALRRRVRRPRRRRSSRQTRTTRRHQERIPGRTIPETQVVPGLLIPTLGHPILGHPMGRRVPLLLTRDTEGPVPTRAVVRGQPTHHPIPTAAHRLPSPDPAPTAVAMDLEVGAMGQTAAAVLPKADRSRLRHRTQRRQLGQDQVVLVSTAIQGWLKAAILPRLP